MIVQVTAVRRDLLDGNEEIFIDGPGIYDGDRLRAAECAPYKGIDTLSFEPAMIRLQHRGETESELVIPYETKGTAVIRSPFGEMELETELTSFSRSPQEIEIGYRLLQDGAEAGRFLLQFTLSPQVHGQPA